MEREDEVLSAMRTLAEALKASARESRELREEVVRLREEFAKLHANPRKKDELEARVEGFAPIVAEALRAFSGKKKGRG